MATQNLRIRRATPDDAAAIAAFGARVFEETFGADNRPEDLAIHLADTYGVERQTRELSEDTYACHVAEVGDHIAGYALMRWGPAPECVTTKLPLEILRFYVDRPFHGIGVARRLMDACVADAMDRGATAVWLGVWERNSRAIRFYEKSGFRDVGAKRFLLGSDEQTDRVMMRELVSETARKVDRPPPASTTVS